MYCFLEAVTSQSSGGVTWLQCEHRMSGSSIAELSWAQQDKRRILVLDVRVQNIEHTQQFYDQHLGMKLLRRLGDLQQGQFTSICGFGLYTTLPVLLQQSCKLLSFQPHAVCCCSDLCCSTCMVSSLSSTGSMVLVLIKQCVCLQAESLLTVLVLIKLSVCLQAQSLLTVLCTFTMMSKDPLCI